MADIYNESFENFDYLVGGNQQAQQVAAAAFADTSSLGNVVGSTTNIVGFDSGGQPIPIGVAGDANGVNLVFSGSTLTATLAQNINTGGSPTFAALTVGGVLLTPVKNNYTAVVAPAVTDDSAAGYAVGSMWVDTALDDGYMCMDATATAAIWKKITP